MSKPKIAVMVATSGHSGVDSVIGNLVAGLCNRGYRVDLLKIRKHGPYNIPDSENLEIVELPYAHVNSCLFSLARYLHRVQPDVLLTDKYKVNRLALLAKMISRSCTKVVVRMGTTVSRDLQQRGASEAFIHKLSIRLFYHLAQAIIFPSKGSAEDFSREFPGLTSRIRALPSPIVSPELYNLAGEQISHPFLDDKDRKVVIGVGELSKRKNFGLLLRTFAQVRQKITCRLLILGEGRQRFYLEGLARDLGIKEDVDFPGFVQNPYPYMASADLFVLSSLFEGSPVVLMEALGLGLPVVSMNCPSGPEEILDQGRYGHLVSMQDPKDMAGAMIDTLNNPPSSEFQKQGSREYHRDNSVQKYLEAFGLG